MTASAPRHRRSAIKDAAIRALHAAKGELGSVRLRMTVEQASKRIADATWYGALNRLADEGLINDPSRGATAGQVQAELDGLLDLDRPIPASGRGLITLTRAGQLYALVLDIASCAKPAAHERVNHDLDLVLAMATA